MYNTSINVIASIPDINLIIDVISDVANSKSIDDVFDKIYNQNVYGIRTGGSRIRFINGIRAGFLKYQSENHKIIFHSLFRYSQFRQTKRIALYFQLGINDRLFYDLTVDVFLKLFHAGRLTLNKSEFISYLHDSKVKKANYPQWTDSTINTVSYKYLTFLKKLEFLKGRKKKEFTNITFDDPTFIYLVYLINSLDIDSNNFLNNPYVPLLMMSQQTLVDRLKKISLIDYFIVTALGYDLNLELKYDYKEIVDVIAQNYRSEI